MSIRNFKPQISGSKEFSAELKSNKSLLKFAEYAAEQLMQEQSDLFFFSVFQAYMEVGFPPQPVEPNSTLGHLTSLIDLGAAQEFIQASNLKNIMFGKQGLLTIFKLLRAPLLSYDIDGVMINAGGRHRSTALGLIGYTTALALKRAGMPVDEAVDLIDRQQLYVDFIRYNVTDDSSLNLTLVAEKAAGKSIVHLQELEDTSALQFLCTSQLVIQDNSSRKPQAGEIESVELSSVGVNPRNAASVINGFRKGVLDKFKLFRYMSQIKLWEDGYELILKPGFREARYTSYFPATMRKLLDTVSKSLWSHMEESVENNYPFRSLITGCENAIPVFKGGAYKTPTPKTALASSTYISTFYDSFWFQTETVEGWKEHLTGYDFSRLNLDMSARKAKAEANGEDYNLDTLQLNLVELAFQLYHTTPGAETINLDKALTRSKDKISFGVIFEGLLSQLDANLHHNDSSLLEYFDVFDLDEEVDAEAVSDEDLDDAAEYMSESLFDEDL